MPIINLTPHAITCALTGRTFPASGSVARVSSTTTPAGDIDGIPTFVTAYGDVTGLPDAQDGVFLLVSGMVFGASTRRDLIAPGDLVRDANGQPVGCKGFNRKP